MTPNIDVRRNATRDDIESIAVALLTAERAFRKLTKGHSSMKAQSTDRFIRLTNDLKAARFGLEQELWVRDYKFYLSEGAMIERGLIGADV